MYKTTLFEAANASHFIQLGGRDVIRPARIRNRELWVSCGQDDDWIVPDQQIEINDSGESQVQVRSAWGGGAEEQVMRFSVSRPINEGDLTVPGSVIEKA
uniref:Uncharacterized protein n=1 Tax=viral metagenome TaxID=1070528 RepID=A0A6H1ZIM9_9ZZZZ